MSIKKNVNDALISIKPKVIRFTGDKFPAELWSNNNLKRQKISL